MRIGAKEKAPDNAGAFVSEALAANQYLATTGPPNL